MAITFMLDSTTAEGTFIRVLRNGQPFGKILDGMGLYRFYEADRKKLGDAALRDPELERLKAAIQSRYDSRRPCDLLPNVLDRWGRKFAAR